MTQRRPEFMVALGLLPPYSESDVKKAYREKARRLHPDAGGDAEAFKALRAAYERALDHLVFHQSRRTWLGNRVERYCQRQTLMAFVESYGGECELHRPSSYHVVEYGLDFADMMREIVFVRLTGPEVTDQTLALLQEQGSITEEIQSLDLSDSEVTDGGMRHLAQLDRLRFVDLRGTVLTREGLWFLSQMRQIEWLHLQGTRVSFWDRWKLRRSAPHLRIATRETDTAPSPDWSSDEQIFRGLENMWRGSSPRKRSGWLQPLF
ncbi:Chaperone protein DnaJ [Maioricimonas rarisocia]|uniref:Chaperone protein DnaJ n=1 Tax=Maioricimonas rarisocia TaxID=2528026 RepID=A0A517Z7T3_9PLAN|nr:DnaJ domain-containing protein [Maioricimonas rarisocia]QDU38538.1 Chaperone protein DnaJ [Maioricimonas rarisocia]